MHEQQPQQSREQRMLLFLPSFSPMSCRRLPGHTLVHAPQPVHLLLSILMLIFFSCMYQWTEDDAEFPVFIAGIHVLFKFFILIGEIRVFLK